MPVEGVIEYEYELGKVLPYTVFEQVLSFGDQLKHIKHPGVVKLEKLSRYLRTITNDKIQYESRFHSIKIYIEEPKELHIRPWGAICIEKSFSEVKKLEIEIFNEYDKDEPVFIEIRYIYFDDVKLYVTVGFYGRVEIEETQNNLTIKIEPDSKVYIFPH